MSTVQIDVRRSLTRTVALVQARGPKGGDGKDGKASQILYGVGAPAAGFGQNEDTYVNTDTGEFYRKEGGSWLYRATMLGPQGWSPRFNIVNNGLKRVFMLADYVGGAGVKPPTTQGGLPVYVSSTGFTTDINAAQDMLGYWGWTPVYGAVQDGLRVVYQLTDYIGGTGTKPSVLSGGNPQYVGAAGLVTAIASATDFRGYQGYDGWEPVLANEVYGLKIVQKIVDWIGGSGTKPSLPLNPYISSTGYNVIAMATDIRGAQGYDGWEPVYANEVDGLRVVQKLVDWIGGAGTKPAIPNPAYKGSTGFVALASATDIRGAQGYDGWEAVLSNEVDGLRVVQKITDWIGGTGTKPAIPVNPYVTAAGFGTKANAVDIRGAQGYDGWEAVYANVTDGLRVVQQLVDWMGGGGTKPAVPATTYRSGTGHTTSIAAATDIRGPQGYDGWEPIYVNVVDGQRVVQKLADWMGGGGTKPNVPANTYLGSSGLVTDIATATDIRGAQGYQGWAPVFSIVTDGARRVYQLTDWTGGAGTKPAITSGGNPQYVGAAGFTTILASAIDIRGPVGPQGANTTAEAVTTTANSSFSSTTVQAALVELADNSIVNALIF